MAVYFTIMQGFFYHPYTCIYETEQRLFSVKPQPSTADPQTPPMFWLLAVPSTSLQFLNFTGWPNSKPMFIHINGWLGSWNSVGWCVRDSKRAVWVSGPLLSFYLSSDQSTNLNLSRCGSTALTLYITTSCLFFSFFFFIELIFFSTPPRSSGGSRVVMMS